LAGTGSVSTSTTIGHFFPIGHFVGLGGHFVGLGGYIVGFGHGPTAEQTVVGFIGHFVGLGGHFVGLGGHFVGFT